MKYVVRSSDLTRDGAIQYLGSKPQAVDSAINDNDRRREVRCTRDLLRACTETHALVEVLGTPGFLTASRPELFGSLAVPRGRSREVVTPIPAISGLYLVRLAPSSLMFDKEFAEQKTLFGQVELGEAMGGLHIGAVAAVILRKKYGIDITGGRRLRTSDAGSEGIHHSMFFSESRLCFGVERDTASSNVGALEVISLQ